MINTHQKLHSYGFYDISLQLLSGVEISRERSLTLPRRFRKI